MTEKYMCPTCKVVVEIDRAANKKTIFIVGIAPPRGMHRTLSFPSHPDCELAKPFQSMDFRRLERIE